MKHFIRWSGIFNILSGILLLLYWYLYALLLPYGQLSNSLALLVMDENYVFINLIGLFGALSGIIGLVGLFYCFEGQMSKSAGVGFILALIGSILMFTTMMRDTLLWPILVGFDPSLLDFSGPIYTSNTFLPSFIFFGLLYTLGFMVFGIAITRSKIFPRWTGHLLAWGALLFGTGPILGEWQVLIRSMGITAMCIGLIWMGILMRLGWLKNDGPQKGSIQTTLA
jgi:hypothetical protein